jgi:hypothetical protein
LPGLTVAKDLNGLEISIVDKPLKFDLNEHLYRKMKESCWVGT